MPRYIYYIDGEEKNSLSSREHIMSGKNLKFFFSLFLIILSIPAEVPLTTSHKENNLSTLNKILKKAREYCQRLEKSVLDYVCIEEVTEVTMPKLYVQDQPMNFQTRVHRKKKTYRYDYQMIRKKRGITENRILIEKNAKKCHIDPGPTSKNV